MFAGLENSDLKTWQSQQKTIATLIARNARLKTKVVQKDEFEKGERRLLNFGHTLGHALENQYGLLHGHAVAIGMVYACRISEKLTGFDQTGRVIQLLKKYRLPTHFPFDKEKVFEVLNMDKKRERKEINYILLDKIGKGVVRSISMKKLESLITQL